MSCTGGGGAVSLSDSVAVTVLLGQPGDDIVNVAVPPVVSASSAAAIGTDWAVAQLVGVNVSDVVVVVRSGVAAGGLRHGDDDVRERLRWPA